MMASSSEDKTNSTIFKITFTRHHGSQEFLQMAKSTLQVDVAANVRSTVVSSKRAEDAFLAARKPTYGNQMRPHQGITTQGGLSDIND
jgi:hypothetical protein